MDTSAEEKLEIKHENNQDKIKSETELQLHLKQKKSDMGQGSPLPRVIPPS